MDGGWKHTKVGQKGSPPKITFKKYENFLQKHKKVD
jgi:hypothetical protein